MNGGIAKWDWNEKKWYYENPDDKDKFKKWDTTVIKETLPDLSTRYDEAFEDEKQKYYLHIFKRGKQIVEFHIHDDGSVDNYDYPLKKEWWCADCETFEELFDEAYSNEDLDKMTDDEIERAGDEIIKKCRCKNIDNYECETPDGMGGGDVHYYISMFPICGGSEDDPMLYLGQFKDIDECRLHLAKYDIK